MTFAAFPLFGVIDRLLIIPLGGLFRSHNIHQCPFRGEIPVASEALINFWECRSPIGRHYLDLLTPNVSRRSTDDFTSRVKVYWYLAVTRIILAGIFPLWFYHGMDCDDRHTLVDPEPLSPLHPHYLLKLLFQHQLHPSITPHQHHSSLISEQFKVSKDLVSLHFEDAPAFK